MPITATDLTLPSDFSVYETSIVLDALNAVPTGPYDCAVIMSYCKGKTWQGLPLDVLVRGLTEKESTFQSRVVGIEKDGTLAFSSWQGHYLTILPFLKSQNVDLGDFLTSIAVQIETLLLLMSRDYDGKDPMTAFKEFGSHTQRIMRPIVAWCQENAHA